MQTAANIRHDVTAVPGVDPILGYRTFGTGPTRIIMLHDWMGDSSNYDASRRWLDHSRYTYVFPDVRGYGLSQALTGKHTSLEIADDVMRLADHLGWDRFHLVGHSMTGMAGFRTLLLDWETDQRVISYVAVTPVTPNGYPATSEDRAFLSAAIASADVAAQAFGALTGGKLGRIWNEDKTARCQATARVDAMKAYYAMWLDEDFALSFQVADIQTPVLVIGGRNDLPGFQQAHFDKTLAAWLPNVIFRYIENAGHYPMEETPPLFAGMLESFIGSVAA